MNKRRGAGGASGAAAEERARLAHGLAGLGLDPGPETLDRLMTHVAEIRRWSGSYNLVARGDLASLVTRHTLDSLAIAPFVAGADLLDVGSGAGFPGLPLAVVQAEWAVTLLDASGKRARFLRHVVRTLRLANVEVVHDRVENFSPGRAFSTIVSRAFSSLGDFATGVRHLVAPHTRVLAVKGRVPDDELRALPCWVAVEEIRPFRVPDLHAERHVVIMSLSPDAA